MKLYQQTMTLIQLDPGKHMSRTAHKKNGPEGP
jgi:hypothetical protein